MNTLTIQTTPKENEFIAAYFDAMAFTEDNNSELDPEFKRESCIDCLAFYNRVSCYLSDGFITQAGCDFWFTRNGHGTGFWDRDCYGTQSITDHLTRVAESFGEVEAYFEEGTQ